MPRYARMLIPDEKAVYHMMSRTALDGFPFGDLEKDEFVRILKLFSKLYFTEIIGFSALDNHVPYHIQTGNRDKFLSLDFGLKEFGVRSIKERLKYSRSLYMKPVRPMLGKVQKSKRRLFPPLIITGIKPLSTSTQYLPNPEYFRRE